MWRESKPWFNLVNEKTPQIGSSSHWCTDYFSKRMHQQYYFTWVICVPQLLPENVLLSNEYSWQDSDHTGTQSTADAFADRFWTWSKWYFAEVWLSGRVPSWICDFLCWHHTTLEKHGQPEKLYNHLHWTKATLSKSTHKLFHSASSPGKQNRTTAWSNIALRPKSLFLTIRH